MNQMMDKIPFTKELYIEDVGNLKIKSFGFSVFSDAEILRAAEVEVWKTEYYGKKVEGMTLTKPVKNGLLDTRMGPVNKDTMCETCHGTYTECPGHYGYLKLMLPVYNAGFLASIINILKCICKSCCRVLLEERHRKDLLKKMRSPKMEAMKKAELVKSIIKECVTETRRKCYRCGYANGSIKKAIGVFGIAHDRARVNDRDLEESRSELSDNVTRAATSFKVADTINPVTVLSLFKRMQEEDCELLNLFDRPEKLILSNIAVPPIAIRPSVFSGTTGGSNENDVSERLKQIILLNSSLRQDLLDSTLASRVLASWDALQVEVAQYIDSDVRAGQLYNQALKKLNGLVQRLKGKQGRFRGNLSGKRVEFTGRTVISPDPNLKITEVGIPTLMALKLTYPERVYKHNIKKLRQLVRNGARKYPGAKFIDHLDGSRMDLSRNTSRAADDLKDGDIVHRHLEDGDIVLFNRQPSLHRMSIMCHRAKVMPWKTLRFNESVCNPYNADFDGDEMNMHVPQTEEARTEALMLMGVQNNLCTPKNGEILVASTQDFLTSSFLITRKDTFYDRASFSLMCSYMGDGMDLVDLPTPAILKPMELWTGKQLFSVLVRPNARVRVYLNFTTKEKSFDKEKNREAWCPNDGFVYFRNSELICGQLGKATLGNGNKGGLFSVLLRDYNAHAAATCMNRLAKLSARWIGNHGFSIGIDDVQPGDALNCQKIERISEGYKKCDEWIHSYNKGQLTLETGCDAAQTVEAKITDELNKIRESAATVCMKELHWRNSPLIMSQCGSKGSPINISQMIACVGQQSVGGQRAPDGFMDRSLPHFPTNSKTPDAKGFVANSFYSGLSATEFFFHTMGGREGLVDTAVKTAETGYMSRRLMKALEDLSIHYDDTVRNASGNIVQLLYGDDGLDPALMEGAKGFPLDFDRLMSKVQATCPAISHVYLTPPRIKEDLKKFVTSYMNTEDGFSASFIKSLSDFLEKRAKLKEAADALGLDKGCVGEQTKLLNSITQNISDVTEKQLQVFLNTCKSRYNSKRLEPGTAIGAIGAQSIGEPGTQMTLKTFHFAGVASMNITQGVPRIREIINVTKNINTPIITATLERYNDERIARIVKGNVEKTTLGQVAKSIKIVINSRSAEIVVKLDMKRIEASMLCIDAEIVKDAIVQHTKIKLKEGDIRVEGKKLRIFPKEYVRNRIKINAHFALHFARKLLPAVVIQGISSVERVVINKIKGTESYNLFAEGKGLRKVMSTEGVNGCKTTSNDINEMQHALGIEAARHTVIEEIQHTMEHHGMSIDRRHMMLLADLMTYKGEVLGITRFGLQKMKDSVLMLASFEKTSEHLFNASVSGRVDQIEGVSECIIMGVPVKVGTGILKVRQSIQQVPQLLYGPEPILS